MRNIPFHPSLTDTVHPSVITSVFGLKRTTRVEKQAGRVRPWGSVFGLEFPA